MLFYKFIGKYLSWNRFLIKLLVVGLQLYRKEISVQVLQRNWPEVCNRHLNKLLRSRLVPQFCFHRTLKKILSTNPWKIVYLNW